jgi:hypothetical protein
MRDGFARMTRGLDAPVSFWRKYGAKSRAYDKLRLIPLSWVWVPPEWRSAGRHRFPFSWTQQSAPMMKSTTALLSFVIVCFAPAPAPAAVAADRPNIVVVLVDDLGFSDIGPYGGEVPTPNLDRLAGQGIRFTQAYNAARCSPSRASL